MSTTTTPPAARAKRPAVIDYEGPWGYQRPIPAHLAAYFDSRPLDEQFRRAYPHRAFPVALASEEAYQLSCACSAYRQQLREDDAA